ncbi:MAG: pectin acetylesterase [Clostridiales bacterium]|nr:pectin acetylesterase [Clostridiales bacterium]MBR2551357.1 pectin acetylesterase [Clostridiales bacterium]
MGNTKMKRIIKVVLIAAVSMILLIALGITVFLKMTILKTFPKLEGEPEIGKWYDVPVENAFSSDGSEWHGIFRKGTENKVVVYFFGGGVSITPTTSEGGKEFYATTMLAQDFVAQGGIGSSADDNPFKDWSFIVIPYATGDFHAGTGIYEGKKKVYHTGYNNYSAFIEKIKPYVGEPDTLLVTGFSAGGFATSLLADDVIDRFPSAGNVTVCVDSSLLLYDGWHDTAVDLWRTPSEISDRLTTDNLVLDSLTALYEKRGDSVKILFDCSYRDDTLMQYQSYIDTGKMDKTKELGDKFQQDLKEMVHGLQTNIPDVGIYIWNNGEDADTHNTQHTIISSNVFNKLGNDRSVGEWMFDAVNGDVRTYGLELLDKEF